MPSTSALVAQTATEKNALPSADITVIGTLTSPKGDIALLRTRNGRVHRVQRGDTVSGHTVAVITEGQVHLVQRNIAKVYAIP